ncbi:MAG: hypothetical protein PVH45_00275 [Candidatus Omnitrophota bacterium]|jgi:hypothetical protein
MLICLAFSALSFAGDEPEVTGILYSSDPMAIVNGELVREGAEAGGWKITKITENFVMFKRGGRSIIRGVGGDGARSFEETKLKEEVLEGEPAPATRVRKVKDLYKKREELEDELQRVHDNKRKAHQVIKRKIEALRGTGAAEMLSPHSANDEEKMYKDKGSWP